MQKSPAQKLSFTAPEANRLDRALAAAFQDISRARFQRLIADGQVSVEGEVILDPGHKLKLQQQVDVLVPPAAAPEPQGEHLALDIVYEDKDLIVINKPPGLVVHPGAGHETGTLVNALIAHCGDSLSGIGGVKRPGIVHRLDKDTSGLLVVAKNDASHQGLSEQFAAHGRDGRLQRSYLALVWGSPERHHGTITTGIARSNSNRQKMAVNSCGNSREAITHYEVEENFGKPPVASLIRCNLETGRTHQIRVHMTHLGYPLMGDQVYGSGFKASISKLPAAAVEALAQLNRQALHAKSLGFDHPRTHKPLFFEADPPSDFKELYLALRVITPN